MKGKGKEGQREKNTLRKEEGRGGREGEERKEGKKGK